jgi:MYXO-CTERM domain-containing protein
MAVKDAIVGGRDDAFVPPGPGTPDAADPFEPPPDDDPLGGRPSDPGAGGGEGIPGAGGTLGSAPPVRLTSASPGVRSLHYDGGCRQSPGSVGALWALALLGAARRRRRASTPLDKA